MYGRIVWAFRHRRSTPSPCPSSGSPATSWPSPPGPASVPRRGHGCHRRVRRPRLRRLPPAHGLRRLQCEQPVVRRHGAAGRPAGARCCSALWADLLRRGGFPFTVPAAVRRGRRADAAGRRARRRRRLRSLARRGRHRMRTPSDPLHRARCAAIAALGGLYWTGPPKIIGRPPAEGLGRAAPRSCCCSAPSCSALPDLHLRRCSAHDQRARRPRHRGAQRGRRRRRALVASVSWPSACAPAGCAASPRLSDGEDAVRRRPVGGPDPRVGHRLAAAARQLRRRVAERRPRPSRSLDAARSEAAPPDEAARDRPPPIDAIPAPSPPRRPPGPGVLLVGTALASAAASWPSPACSASTWPPGPTCLADGEPWLPDGRRRSR